MSDSVIKTEDLPTPDATEQEVETEEQETAEPTIEELRAEVERWKSFSRQNEKRAKEHLSAAQELQSLKEAELSEVDKLTARAERAEAELETVRLEATRSRIAAKHGLTEEDIELFLTATEEEAIESQALALSKRLESKKPRQVNVNNSDLEGVPSVDPNSALAKQMFQF